MRLALYFTPPADHPLVEAAEAWLGRSAFARGAPSVIVAGWTPQARAEITADPRRYGFHGTFKAPFRLAEGRRPADLAIALDAYCAQRAPIAPVRLAVSRLGGFLALTPPVPAPELAALAGDVVRHFEPFRATLSETEMARRRPESLTPRQRAHLETWGYPYVFDEFRFHMTLTGRLTDEIADRLAPELESHFADVLREPVPFEHVALFEEQASGLPFTCIRLARLAGHVPANQ